MNRYEAELGMGRDITRRDFIHDVSLSALGLMVPAGAFGRQQDDYYPPTRTGLRGSHPGSFEVAHALAREGKTFGPAEDTGERCDLVVVGGGISGLATAWYYRKLFGQDSGILILENHDDFGGHAKRNEFHQGGALRLAWGGVFNLEYTEFSDTVNALMAELGIDIETLVEGFDFDFGKGGRLGPAVFFDAETYGQNVLVPGFGVHFGDHAKIVEKIDLLPLDEASRASLKAFYAASSDVLAGASREERERYLRETSYIDFLRRQGGLTEQAAALYIQTTHGYWGVGADSLSIAECLDAGLPGLHLLGTAAAAGLEPFRQGIAMFPDGNASVARLIVRGLIPGVAPGDGMEDIVTAPFDYGRLDRPGSPVRLRLNSTVVHAERQANGVTVTYINDGKAKRVTGRHCVLACWHSIIPFLCPDLPQAQKEALAYQVKRPLLLTNVLIRSGAPFDQLGVSGAYCPGRLHGESWLVRGVNAGGYRDASGDDGAAVVMFWGSVAPPEAGLNVKEQHRASRARMLAMSFKDYEREVRSVLDGMLRTTGFNAADDILAITVNRWPHGYAYDYLDLWDSDWPPGQAPHEIARRPFGNITIANADAGADAYTHVAIDQAWRAVNELRSQSKAM